MTGRLRSTKAYPTVYVPGKDYIIILKLLLFCME